MATGTDMFAYLAAFVTITLALALGDMVQSLHRLLRARGRVRWHALPLVAAAFVLLSVLSEFFSLWQFRGLVEVSYYGLVGLMVVPTLIALAACAALPDDVPDGGLDLRAFHFANRRYLFSVMALAFATDYVRTTVQAWHPGTPVAQLGANLLTSMSGPTIVVLLAMAWSARPWLHGAGLAVLLVLAQVGFAGWTIGQPPGSAPRSAPSPGR
jgi:hypothetical protein